MLGCRCLGVLRSFWQRLSGASQPSDHRHGHQGTIRGLLAVRGTIMPLITDYLTTGSGRHQVKQVLVERRRYGGKKGQPLVILSSNPTLQLQVASCSSWLSEQNPLQHQHDLLDIEHQGSPSSRMIWWQRIRSCSTATRLRPRPTNRNRKTRRDYNVVLRNGDHGFTRCRTESARDAVYPGRNVRSARRRQCQRGRTPSTKAPMDGALSALDAEVGQSKALGGVLGREFRRRRPAHGPGR